MRKALGIDIEGLPRDIGGAHFEPQECAMLEVLLKRERLGVDALMMALADPTRPDAEPNAKIIDVRICRLRKKLVPMGVEIENEWGGVYFMRAASKKRLKGLIDAARETAA